jgi:sugar (pentulose or hexulose) kinase
MRLLGIDLGGTYLKSGLLNAQDGSVDAVRRVRMPGFKSNRPARSKVLQLSEILDVVSEELRQRLGSVADVVGVCIASQMHTTVLVDENGQPWREECITWQDERSLHDGSWELVSSACNADLRWSVGNEMKPGYPLATIVSWVRSGKPDLGRWRLTNIADYVLETLLGIRLPMHVTQAAATGLWSVQNQRWADDVLHAIGIAGIRLPDVASHPHCVEGSFGGRALRAWPSIGDQQASLVGAGLQTTELSLNVATGSQASTLIGKWPSAKSSAYQLRPYFNNQLLATVTHLPAGRALTRVATMLCEVAGHKDDSQDLPWATLELFASQVDPQDGPVADLSLYPCRTGDKGWITGLTEKNCTAGHIYHAAIRSMVSNYSKAARDLPVQSFQRIRCSGGVFAKSELFRNQLTTAFSMPYVMGEHKEESLSGLLQYVRACD